MKEQQRHQPLPIKSELLQKVEELERKQKTIFVDFRRGAGLPVPTSATMGKGHEILGSLYNSRSDGTNHTY